MQNWLKRSALIVGVFGICWIGAVWYWRSTTRMPDTGDLALAMLVMPLTLIASFWLAQKTFATAATARAGGAQAAAEPAAAAVERVPDAAATAGAWQPLGVAGAALRMPHGESAAELAAAMAEGQARLDLDPELTDLQGFPLLAGRVPDVDLAPLQEWISAQQSPSSSAKPAPHQLRAMALGGEVAARLAARAGAFGADSALQLLPVLPQEWPPAMQELATRWLQHCVSANGWPEKQLSAQQSSTPLAALRALSAQAAANSAPPLSILLACDSGIDQNAVERLAVNGKLYSARKPNGRMPAEGAAGVLLQPPHEAHDAVRLLALQADTDGEATLTGLASTALEQAHGQAPLYIAADTDHRAAVMADLMQCVGTAAPALDTDTALACIGTACGHTGAVGAVAAIALAHEQAADNGGFALALANSDPTQRYALLIGPLPAPPSKAPSLS
jgi:hypothetical protein